MTILSQGSTKRESGSSHITFVCEGGLARQSLSWPARLVRGRNLQLGAVVSRARLSYADLARETTGAEQLLFIVTE